VYEKISQASKASNPLALSILALTDITSDDDILQIKNQLEKAQGEGDPLATEILNVINQEIAHEPLKNLKKALLFIANPLGALNALEREQYKALQAKIADAGQKGNQLASAVLAVTEATTDAEIQRLADQLSVAQGQNDEIALLVISLTGSIVPVVAIASVSPSAPAQEQQLLPQQPVAQVASTTQNVQIQSAQPIAAVMPTFASLNENQAQQSMPVFQQNTPNTQTQGVSSPIDSMPNNAGLSFQASNTYNYSGIPAQRPINYVAPQSRQGEIA
jgi:hypothetical protein